MGSNLRKPPRMTWAEMLRSERCRGRWVALDNVVFDPTTSQPFEAELVDVDEDLAVLCARMRAADRTSCAIRLCEEDPRSQPIRRAPSQTPPRAAQH
jgi:hypothetical protein